MSLKIILSRKGFDSSNGRMASPILPNGHMLSLPIPDTSSDDLPAYKDLSYEDYSYASLISSLSRSKKVPHAECTCHVDPDLLNCYGVRAPAWHAAFGQIGAAQGYLRNAGVSIGDLFLFYGWFRETETRKDGTLRYKRGKPSGVHAVFGYLEIGRILTDPQEIQEYSWHPHALPHRLPDRNNALYLPADTLSLDPRLPGYGLLNYREDRVLTAPGRTRSKWSSVSREFLLPNNLVHTSRKNTAKENDIVVYRGIFQELVYNGTEKMIGWAGTILQPSSS